jgi:hypothetical protein
VPPGLLKSDFKVDRLWIEESSSILIMATFEDVIVPRKKIATYGKAVRRRIPDYNFGTQPKAPERKQSETLASRSPSITIADPKKLKSVTRTSPSKTPPSAPAIKANVFDVPSSDDEARPPTPKPAPKVGTRPMKSVPRTSPFKSPPPAPAAKTNVFDVPSSDDEAAPPTPKPAPKAAPRQIKNTTQKGTTSMGSSTSVAMDAERRKRVKLSPMRALVQKPSPSKPPARLPIPDSTAHASKQLQRSLGVGHTSTIATRPKPAVVHRKADIPRTPRKISPSPQRLAPAPNTPSPKLDADPDMMDVDTPARYISPRGLQMWKELLDPLDVEEASEIVRGEEILRDGKSTAQLFSKTLAKPAGVTKHTQKNSKTLPRRRLIDSLVEQITNHDDIEDDESDLEESDIISEPDVMLGVFNTQDRSRSQSLVPELPPPPTLTASQGSQNAGPKFTYSRQRSMLAEEDLMAQLALDMPIQPAQTSNGRRPRRGSIPVLKPLQNFNEEAEDEDGAATAIRSVHELRQAGANNRFLDEIEDLLDRIGNPSSPPSSMRRSGLLDLASKVKDKNFVRQFRANGVEQRLFVHLGQETDLIAGFLMVAILMAVLFDASMPHIVAQLRRQGITRLLIRLLESQTSIVSLSKDRKSNMSKVAQSLILEHQDFILKIPLWEDLLPEVISSRTIGLKCLELMVRQTREAGNSGDIISKELTTKLFAILKSASEESSWELPKGKQAIDFYLALSALESHSIVARTVHDESIWISDYLPIIADALEVALKRPANEFGPLQGLILRLTLNVTNNNPTASDVFAKSSLMAVMGQVIVTKFKKILRFLTEEDFSVAVDHLILVLGVMINFAEWSAPARESLQNLQGEDNDPLESMVLLFVENKMRTSEVSVLDTLPNRVDTDFHRPSRWKKVKRMLLLPIFPFYWAPYLCYRQFQRELLPNSQGRHFDP